MNRRRRSRFARTGKKPILLLGLSLPLLAFAGPYSQSSNDPANAFDPPIPGHIGPDGDGIINQNSQLNPAFVAWADRVIDYSPADSVDPGFDDPQFALGPATGDHFDIVSLGDRSEAALTNGAPPGTITLGFPIAIADLPGPDFAVFENAFDLAPNQTFSELAFVEVSTDGTNFARFAAISETPGLVIFADPDIDATGVYNLAGKHINHDAATTWGTPFDLEELHADPLVTAGLIDLLNVRYVRIVDIPGNGFFTDQNGHPIYDLWPSEGSAGFDLEAVGILNPRVHARVSRDGSAMQFVAPMNRMITLQATQDLLNPDWQNLQVLSGDGLGKVLPINGYKFYRLAMELP